MSPSSRVRARGAGRRYRLTHRKIRRVAEVYGGRSGTLGSLRLVKGVMTHLVATGAVAVGDVATIFGGLVSLAEPEALIRLTRRALSEAHHCSSDPLCAERLPRHPDDFLHGAACHVCLFVSETSCERGNRFLDRRFVVPVGDPDLALFSQVP